MRPRRRVTAPTPSCAFHRADGAIRPRVPPIKLLASAITIGSGGSAGREGPIALVAAGVGSWYASVTGRAGRDRRLLMLTGMAAGLSAIFRSPIGTALMAIEVLYADMELEAGALLYALLSSIVAYALNGFVDGWEPLFRLSAPLGRLPSALDYGWYVGLGVAAGVAATLVPVVFYRVRDLFRVSRIPRAAATGRGGAHRGVDGRRHPAGDRRRLRLDAARDRRPHRVRHARAAGGRQVGRDELHG